MKLAASGLTMGTTVSSMAALLQGATQFYDMPPEGDCKPPQAAAGVEDRAQGKSGLPVTVDPQIISA
jgi:hypothetical protein